MRWNQSRRTSRNRTVYVGAYPNAGLPDPLSPTGFLKRRIVCTQTCGVGGERLAEYVGAAAGLPEAHSQHRERRA